MVKNHPEIRGRFQKGDYARFNNQTVQIYPHNRGVYIRNVASGMVQDYRVIWKKLAVTHGTDN